MSRLDDIDANTRRLQEYDADGFLVRDLDDLIALARAVEALPAPFCRREVVWIECTACGMRSHETKREHVPGCPWLAVQAALAKVRGE